MSNIGAKNMRTKESPKHKKKWIKPRHRIIRDVAYTVLYPYMCLK